MILFFAALTLFSILVDVNCFLGFSKKTLQCGDNSLVDYGKNGLPTNLPWSVSLKYVAN